MNTVTRHFKEDNGQRIAMVWIAESEEKGSVIDHGVVSEDASFDLNDPKSDVPDGWSEITEAEYQTSKEARNSARRAEFQSRYEAAENKKGILNNLIDNADNLLGGILG